MLLLQKLWVLEAFVLEIFTPFSGPDSAMFNVQTAHNRARGMQAGSENRWPKCARFTFATGPAAPSLERHDCDHFGAQGWPFLCPEEPKRSKSNSAGGSKRAQNSLSILMIPSRVFRISVEKIFSTIWGPKFGRFGGQEYGSWLPYSATHTIS